MKIAVLADPHLSFLMTDDTERMFTHSRQIVDAAIASVNEDHFDLALWLGDLTHEGTQETRDAFADALTALQPPTMQICGNHDVEIPSKQTFAETIPIVGRAILAWESWTVVFVDYVVEHAPHAPNGVVHDEDEAILRQAVHKAAGGPLLVISHQAPREFGMDNPQRFHDAVAHHTGTLVSLAGHTHRNYYVCDGNRHFIERSSLTAHPLELHALTLSPSGFHIEPIRQPFDPFRDMAGQRMASYWQDEALQVHEGDKAAQVIDISVI